VFPRAITLAAILIPPLALADAVVTFNELNYNPVGSQDNEWVELHNQMSVNVDISGWRIADGITFTFPSATVIPAGGRVIVAKSTANPALTGLPGVYGPFSGSLSNGGETLELLNKSNRLMDQVEYSDRGDWPLSPDGVGTTLAKKVPGSDSEDPASWTASRQSGGTPGVVNFPPPAAAIQHQLVADDASWKYNDTNLSPAAGWSGVSYNDVGWPVGSPAFGTTGTTPVLTVTSNLVSRYRAGAVTGVSNGATFSQWADTATGDGVSQDATAGGNPTFRASATPNGEPAVRFDGNDEFRAALPPGISAASGFVYFIVCKANSVPDSGGVADGSGDYIFDRDSTAADPPLISLKAVNGRYGFQKRDDGNTNIGGPVSTTPISTSQFQIVAARRNPAASRYEIWVDGVMESTVAEEGDNITPQPIVIGRHSNSVEQGFDGDIAELLVYKSGLSDTEFQAVGAYLEARYGLNTAFPNTAVATPLAPTTTTSYFRKTFSFSGDPARTELRLDSTVADGAAFYLNGQEIKRSNLPAGNLAHSTPASSDISQPAATGYLPVPSSALVSGTNVLAVSLHKASGNSSSFFTGALAATEQPPDTTQAPSLQINEIAAVSDPAFFIELRNNGTSTVSTSGYKLSIAGGAAFTLPAISVPSGGFVSYTKAQLGLNPVADDKIVLTAPPSLATDVQLAATTRGGRNAAFPGKWLHPSVTTPGAENQFTLNTDIVINEICYKAPDLPAISGSPAVTTGSQILSYGSQWRYNPTGIGLATGWASSAHAGGSGGWLAAAPGTFSYPNPYNGLPLAPATSLTSPSGKVTYYFETDFNLSAQDAANLESLTISHLIDDGGVIYLNGVEITRYNLPAGEITSTTTATNRGTPSIIGPVTFAVPAGTTVAGVNRISVEVHQSSNGSSDAVFALQATANIITTPAIPTVPATASTQQWIELKNRGTSTVDLSGWKFTSGITYTFPPGVSLAPGAYRVITRDGTTPPASPGLGVLGPWSGSLSGGGEKISLVDSADNPVDEVSYVDGGRWPAGADGEGSTLELRDARSDNSLAESWAASDETARRSWETITYQGVAGASATGPDNQWRDFIFGLLDAGEVLIDDITVTENPGGSNTAMISNGNFESGSTGWRFLGNHADATVITDPDSPANHVLRLRATGATEHMHNHVETTLAAGRSVVNGRTYRISFRARWVSGTNKLNTRLYFNRLAHTSILTRTQTLGTPGAANTRALTNAGPGFYTFTHSPAVPQPGESVKVTATVADPDGLGPLSLFYSQSGAPFTSLPMTGTGDGKTFTANIPGQSAASVTRFYVAATDAAALPSTAFFPAEGPDSHALYQVNDGLAATNGLNNLRIVMDPADKAFLYQTTNLMSNGRIGCTVIYNESEVYYNTGVRLKSSQRGRQNSARVGFNLSFNDDQLFRGALSTVAIDRSEGQITGAREILFDHMMYASGGVPGEYNDLCKVVAPDPAHTSTAILQMARFGSDFLDTQFDNGADGTVYEYELIYYPTSADASGYKLPQPDNVVGVDITSFGDDKENYRWTYLTKNSEDKDDYSKVIAMAKLFDSSGGAFDSTVNDVLDVDQWLRATAYSCASGAGDSFFANANHNGQFYARPSDGRMLYFPHDMDFAFDVNMGIFTNTELQKLVADPVRLRLYLGHLHNICHTVFNQSYMAPWTAHYGSLLPNEDFSGHLSYINRRSNFILGQIDSSIAPVAFSITTNGGADFSASGTPVTLAGQGWVDVRNIRLAGSSSSLAVTWTSSNTWQLSVPVNPGVNVINLEAIDHDGAIVGADSITIANNGNVQLPGADNLVVSAIYYNPLVTDDTSEYLEIRNISPAIVDLSGMSLTGITFTFANGATLAPGARVVLVKNLAAFEAEFGTGRPVAAGLFTGSLDNAGEVITLRRANGDVFRSFEYSDDPPWPLLPDTAGYALVLIDPFSNPDHSDPLSWRASANPGGSPGIGDSVSYAAWKTENGNLGDNLDSDGDGHSNYAEYILGGNPLVPESFITPVFTREAGGTLLLTINRRADIGAANVHPRESTDLASWQAATGALLISNDRLPGTPAVDRLQFRFTPPPAASSYFIGFGLH